MLVPPFVWFVGLVPGGLVAAFQVCFGLILLILVCFYCFLISDGSVSLFSSAQFSSVQFS